VEVPAPKQGKAPEFTPKQVITMLQHQVQTREATREGTSSAAAKRQAWKDLTVVVNECDALNLHHRLMTAKEVGDGAVVGP
jgi:hypothetical protein